jgi:pimeloyl-ACP methyl ester carboxylesterase
MAFGAAAPASPPACADHYGWSLIASTMVYRDFFDPRQLRQDAQEDLPRVHGMLESVRAGVTGLQVAPRLLVYGFSRGAQMAHRFSMIYPREVAVAVLSAGSYTSPDARTGAGGRRPPGALSFRPAHAGLHTCRTRASLCR